MRQLQDPNATQDGCSSSILSDSEDILEDVQRGLMEYRRAQEVPQPPAGLIVDNHQNKVKAYMVPECHLAEQQQQWIGRKSPTCKSNTIKVWDVESKTSIPGRL